MRKSKSRLTIKIAIVMFRPRFSEKLLQLPLCHKLHDHVDWRCNDGGEKLRMVMVRMVMVRMVTVMTMMVLQ